MSYKYLINPSCSSFTIFILHCMYIFRVYLSRISLHTLSHYQYTYLRIWELSTIRDILQVFGLPSINHLG